MTYLSCGLSIFCFSVFWFRKAGYSGLQAGFSGYLDRSLRTYTRSLRVQLTDTHFIEWITCHMHHTYSWHSPVHPTVKLIRAFVVLLIDMPKLLTCQVKIEIQSSWHTFRGSSYMLDVFSLYDYQMSYMWVVINHQKGGDWKWFRPLKWVLVVNDKTHVRLIV